MADFWLWLSGVASLLAVVGGLSLLSFFAIGAVAGAPYLPSRQTAIARAFALLDLKPGQTIIDLGSGSGTVLVAAAQRGIGSIGYELNPVLWLWSWLRTRKYGRLVSVKLGNYWKKQLPATDAIYVFLIDRYMLKLDQKLKAEVKTPTWLISFVFKVPGKKPVIAETGLYLYRY